MNNTTEAITAEFEIVPAELGLEPASKLTIETAFEGFFSKARDLSAQAAVITDPKLARAARLEIKKLRVEAEKKHKDMKADVLLYGRAVDGVKNIFLALVTPIERGLDDIEKQEERRLAAEKAQLNEDRIALVKPYLDPTMPLPTGDLADLTEDQFTAVLGNYRLLAETKAAAAKKTEEDRLAAEKAAAEEQERIRLENGRLKAEAAEKEKALAAERAETERLRLEAEAKAKAERDAIEAEAKAKRAEMERLAEIERIKLADIAAEEKRKTDALIAAAAEAARAEREARDKIEAEVRAQKEAAEAKVRAEQEAAAKAAAAPDREKLLAFADHVKTLNPGTFTTSKGVMIQTEVLAQIDKFATWLRGKANDI